MTDITMCDDKTCAKRESCYRFTAPVNPYRQAYFYGRPSYPDGCDEFTSNEGWKNEPRPCNQDGPRG